MRTALKTRPATAGQINNPVRQPQRLSAIGKWWKENPAGILRVIDRRAVNK
ncbi:MAG: hypothetical protein LBG77_00900 [Dysgonamonadaceae bacterium]|jgi:hypothetical protein|nr:hypothetical protein [Dysgonamonadaceae bacterium]